MIPFIDRYRARVTKTKSILCVGLDPTPEHVPQQFGPGIGGMEHYLRHVMQLAAILVPYVKLQYSYYADLGHDGIRMMIRLFEYAHYLGLQAGLDGKRSEIDRSMKAYGGEVFGQYGADFCTVVPYLGPTFVEAWMDWFKKGHAAISMVLTSNPEGLRLQGAILEGGLRVYEQLAIWTNEWDAEVREKSNGCGAIGAVVGATQEQALRCRELLTDHVFTLIPGYGGGQGGSAANAVLALITSEGGVKGIVNNSSGVTQWSWLDRETRQPKPGDPLERVRETIEACNRELNQALGQKLGKPVSEIFAIPN